MSLCTVDALMHLSTVGEKLQPEERVDEDEDEPDELQGA